MLYLCCSRTSAEISGVLRSLFRRHQSIWSCLLTRFQPDGLAFHFTQSVDGNLPFEKAGSKEVNAESRQHGDDNGYKPVGRGTSHG